MSVLRRAFMTGLGAALGCGRTPAPDGGGGGTGGGTVDGGGTGDNSASDGDGIDGSGSDDGPHRDPGLIGCMVWGSRSVESSDIEGGVARWGSISVGVRGAGWWCSASVEV